MKNLSNLSKDELLRILYDRYKANISFTEVRRELATEQHRRRESGDYLYVTRRIVLGRMREIKKYMFEARFGRLTKKEIIKILENPDQVKQIMHPVEEVF